MKKSIETISRRRVNSMKKALLKIGIFIDFTDKFFKDLEKNAQVYQEGRWLYCQWKKSFRVTGKIKEEAADNFFVVLTMMAIKKTLKKR